MPSQPPPQKTDRVRLPSRETIRENLDETDDTDVGVGQYPSRDRVYLPATPRGGKYVDEVPQFNFDLPPERAQT